MAQRITPYLLYEDAEAALEWLGRAFGFREVDRAIGGAGGIHLDLELEPGGPRIYLGSPPGGEFRNPAKVGRTSLLYVLVPDVDAHYERAKREGAEIVEEPNDLPYGDRRYGCRDVEGHEWFFATAVQPSHST